MSKTDAERAMDIYRSFTKQTDFVVQYLTVAKQYEHHTRVEVPKLKHAPVNLGRQLEEYLKDADFEVHRRQYLAELELKKGKGGSSTASSRLLKGDSSSKADSSKPSASVNGSRQTTSQATKAPAPDLIDFFDSIEQNQQPLGAQPPAQVQAGVTPWSNNPFPMQQTGFVAQPTGFPSNSPFQQPFVQQQAVQPLQTQFTGAGFGGFTPQPSFQPSSLAPIPQDSVVSFRPNTAGGLVTMQNGQQSTNPFRQSTLLTGQANSPFAASPSPQTPQSTNPFARQSVIATQPFQPAAANSFATQAPAPLQAMATGTNPFAKNFGGSQQPPQQQRPMTAGALVPQPTGTNPFRQGAFVNHTTGLGWQHNQQPMGGGLDQLQTIPVFPRPAQQTPWQQ
jgi:hypothetical protein